MQANSFEIAIRKAERPMIADGGGLEIKMLDATKGVLVAELRSTCKICPNYARSARSFIERVRSHTDYATRIEILNEGQITASYYK